MEKSTKRIFLSSLEVLPYSDRRKMIFVTLIQILLGVLDLLGIALIGILGSLAIKGVQSSSPTGKVGQVLEFLNIGSLSLQGQALILGIAAASALILRSVCSIYFTKRILYFLSRRGAIISSNLLRSTVHQNLDEIQQQSAQENIYSLTVGVNNLLLGVIGTSVMIVSDAILLIIISFGLFVVDPIVASCTLIIFTSIGYALYRLMHVRAENLGKENAKNSIENYQELVDLFKTYREIVTKNRQEFFIQKISKTRFNLAEISAEIAFMPNISKYALETSVVVGALLISAAQFVLQDAAHAIGTLSIFLAAGTRIAPALLRIQQGLLTINNSLGSAQPTITLIDNLGTSRAQNGEIAEISFTHEAFSPEVKVSQLEFRYINNSKSTISNITLELVPGESLAVVGPSGSGKSTFLDLILGVLKPSDGNIRISGKSPNDAAATWPGAISYVPQDVVVVNGTIAENITLGFVYEDRFEEQVLNCISSVHLTDFVSDLPNGIHTRVGDTGAILSGGQKQRLGIARALFTNPKLLILDEATSALDAETENAISESIKTLRGITTLIVVAHRLSTVRDLDKIAYIKDGKLETIGNFEEVRNQIPDFDSQAKLMGL
jgi:ABC-type multidrug transport system fused ATPase/permease subunit